MRCVADTLLFAVLSSRASQVCHLQVNGSRLATALRFRSMYILYALPLPFPFPCAASDPLILPPVAGERRVIVVAVSSHDLVYMWNDDHAVPWRRASNATALDLAQLLAAFVRKLIQVPLPNAACCTFPLRLDASFMPYFCGM